MKKVILIISTLLLITVNSCDKKGDFMGEGVITGVDLRDCACCGGLLINLNSDSTKMYTVDTYQIDKVPSDFNIDANTSFPVFIRLDYQQTNALCGKTIDILRFEIR
jgi:hypothetical protein